MESYQITIQNAQQDLLPDRQDAVDLGTGERCMEEESDLDLLVVADFLT